MGGRMQVDLPAYESITLTETLYALSGTAYTPVL